MGNVIVSLIVLLIVGLAIRNIVKNRKEGKMPCGCDCGGCSLDCHNCEKQCKQSSLHNHEGE